MQYEVNKTIPLAQTRIQFDIVGQRLDTPAEAVLRMLPSPGLVINCEVDLMNSNVGPLGFQQNSLIATIHNQKNEFIVKQLSFHRNPEEFQAAMVLIPMRQPLSVQHTDDSLASVEFSILNFPRFLGMQDKTVESNGSCNRIGAVKLQADHWVVDIEAVSNLSEVKQELDTTGGYGISHTGRVERSDGVDFSVADVERLLFGLTLFLSFARGTYCGLTLVKGKSRDGRVTWERWGTDRVTGWSSSSSWFDRHHGHLLASVFPGFWHLYKKQEDDLRVLITLYLDSNLGRSHGVGFDGGLILTQAALERVAHKVGGGETGYRIKKALMENRIVEEAFSISPDSCPELAKLATEHCWEHGPHALVEIRNNVVHPRQKYGKIPAMAYYEAWNLGQWYLELMLLSLFGASGEYGNRLTQKWVGQVEPLDQWLVESGTHITKENG